MHEYDVVKYDRRTREDGLFVENINTFLKLKARWVRTPEDEERYVDDSYAREGLRLDRDATRPNAAKRGLAKLCLNSLWGKLVERQNRSRPM